MTFYFRIEFNQQIFIQFKEETREVQLYLEHSFAWC